MQHPPTLAIIGCGFIYRSVYAPILQTHPDRARVIALVDVNADAAREATDRFPGAQFFAGLDALLASPVKPDAALVLTPERFNTPSTLRLLDAGLPVYLEKPPSIHTRELLDLIRKEASARVPVYTAFNRRHTPLLRDWTPPAGLKKVRGILSRKGRPVENFPYTGCHVLDAAPYFAGSPFAETRVRFDASSGPVRWTVEGRLENRAACELVFIPDHDAPDETLVFETDNGEWTLNFPNTHTAHPFGRITRRDRDGRVVSDLAGRSDTPWQTNQGYTDTLLDFLNHLSSGTLAESPHRLPRALRTIDVMERMMAAPLQPA